MINYLNKSVNNCKKTSSKIKIIFLLNSCRRSGPTQVMLHIISNLDQNAFEPYLVTIYEENKTSRLSEFMPHVTKHIFVKTSKLKILMNTDRKLRKVLEDINPDVIHTLGVFSDFAVSRIPKYRTNHLITAHNFVYEDFIMAFGKIRGTIIAKMHLHAMKHAKTVACSESLSTIYYEKLGLNFDYIRNGVEIANYCPPTKEIKCNVRKELGVFNYSFVFIYTGSFLPRKNISFMLEGFLRQFNGTDVVLLLVGSGGQWEEIKEKYENHKNIIFTGHVSDVEHYLYAADAFISTSMSEGMPMSVLEAISSGLPIVLSDIPQHEEIIRVEKNIGFLYKQNSLNDFQQKLQLMLTSDVEAMGAIARKCAETVFSAKAVSYNYQQIYKKLAENKKN